MSAAEDGVGWGAVRGHQELRKIFFPIAGTTPPRLQYDDDDDDFDDDNDNDDN